VVHEPRIFCLSFAVLLLGNAQKAGRPGRHTAQAGFQTDFLLLFRNFGTQTGTHTHVRGIICVLLKWLNLDPEIMLFLFDSFSLDKTDGQKQSFFFKCLLYMEDGSANTC
jgi:hypothetical protein